MSEHPRRGAYVEDAETGRLLRRCGACRRPLHARPDSTCPHERLWLLALPRPSGLSAWELRTHSAGRRGDRLTVWTMERHRDGRSGWAIFLGEAVIAAGPEIGQAGRDAADRWLTDLEPAEVPHGE